MPPRPRIQIPASILAELATHAKSSHPLECCGLLAGLVGESAYEVRERIPLTNRLQSKTEFESEPIEMLRASRLMRQKQLELLVVYHSHPSSKPIPSHRDKLRNIDERVACLIIGPGDEIRIWWLEGMGEQVEAEWDTVADIPFLPEI